MVEWTRVIFAFGQFEMIEHNVLCDFDAVQNTMTYPRLAEYKTCAYTVKLSTHDFVFKAVTPLRLLRPCQRPTIIPPAQTASPFINWNMLC